MVVHFEDTAFTNGAVVCAVGFRIIAFLTVPGSSVVFDG